MSNCYVCKGKSTVKHLDREICKSCFIKIIESRIRKQLTKKFEKNDTIFTESNLSKNILKKILKDFPINFVDDKNEATHIINTQTASDIADEFVTKLTSNTFDILANNDISLFATVTDEEISQYAKLTNQEFIPKKKISSKFFAKLDKYKEIEYNLSRNVQEL
tara:strand:- start:5037 stop:5525 length:489 start_codon:yes stop_codon:yes gene_type:complete